MSIAPTFCILIHILWRVSLYFQMLPPHQVTNWLSAQGHLPQMQNLTAPPQEKRSPPPQPTPSPPPPPSDPDAPLNLSKPKSSSSGSARSSPQSTPTAPPMDQPVAATAPKLLPSMISRFLPPYAGLPPQFPMDRNMGNKDMSNPDKQPHFPLHMYMPTPPHLGGPKEECIKEERDYLHRKYLYMIIEKCEYRKNLSFFFSFEM